VIKNLWRNTATRETAPNESYPVMDTQPEALEFLKSPKKRQPGKNLEKQTSISDAKDLSFGPCVSTKLIQFWRRFKYSQYSAQ
jgi:hypothetical protein